MTIEVTGNIKILLNALNGISSCATACKCCEMHRQIARKAVADYQQSLSRVNAQLVAKIGVF
ncbi:MAG: hypothetical protein M3O26_10630 [Pseudomonadota bacterium]|nr:hypothetical protein [Pseudomonadota bacterium]